jgi:hypothetical protein
VRRSGSTFGKTQFVTVWQRDLRIGPMRARFIRWNCDREPARGHILRTFAVAANPIRGFSCRLPRAGSRLQCEAFLWYSPRQ